MTARSKLLKSGLSFASGTLLSRVFGFARDVAIAAVFGAGSASDAFFIAQRIPNLFRRMFAEGAFAAAFVPLLNAARAESLDAMQAFAGQSLLRMLLYLGLFTVLVELAAPLVAALFAPGFRADAEQFTLLVQLLRLCFPYLIFISLAALAASWLQCQQRFAASAYAPVLLNLALLAACWQAWRSGGDIIYLGWGILAAGIAQCLLLFFCAHRRGLRPTLRWRPNQRVQRLYKLMLPTMFSASVTQLSLLIDSILASLLVSASVSWLYFADRLMELPLGLIGVSIATVVLPKLSAQALEHDQSAYRQTLDWALRLSIGLALPAALALALIAEPLIKLIYQHQAFGAENVHPVSQALRAYALGLPFFMLVKIITNAYFAHQDSRTPMRCALIATACNIALSLLLVQFYAATGLALATSLGAVINVLLLLVILHRRGWYSCVNLESGRELFAILIACAGLVGYLVWLQASLSDWLAGSWGQLALATALLCGGGLLLYLTLWQSTLRLLLIYRRAAD